MARPAVWREDMCGAAGRDGEPSAREGRAVKNLKNDHIWGGGSVTDYTEGEGGETYRIWQAERGSETDRTRSSNTPISPNDQLSARPGAFAAHF